MDGEEWDAIVIGSGIGGLATASIVAQLKNWRVLVLERHFKAGGFTHAFRREGKFRWDVGVHYIGGLQPGSMLREIFDWISGGAVQWQKMPDPFEKFIYPEFTFAIPDDPAEFQALLEQQFTGERGAIAAYFQDVRQTASWFGRHVSLKALPAALQRVAGLLKLIGRGHALMTTREYMESNFRDPKLRAILLSQWGDYGLPPAESAFVIHALIATHYFGGAYYPIGGAGTIAASIEPIIQDHGGSIRLNHHVEEILIENGRVCGVRSRKIVGERQSEHTFRAPRVISDAGAYNTFLRLLPPAVEIPFRSALAELRQGVSCVTLYLGFDEDPRRLGFQGENYWIYDDYDHDAIFSRRQDVLQGKISAAYLSFPSLKDPMAQAHTAEIITFCDYAPFQAWSGEAWKNRGAEYEALKQRIADGLLDFVERHLPGLKSRVVYQELSTPLSNEYFTAHPQGSIYGLACTPERFQLEWLGVRTPVQGLYLTGADASSPGVAGALMGGVMSAAALLDFPGVLRLFKELKNARAN
ncbi:MAG: NAD(P)/FAD-dependent oxidoreductase [Leptospirales bacterium]|nr:NAD(P)/FAD-dependent oxidoreductase [Leptospirales bacterium]